MSGFRLGVLGNAEHREMAEVLERLLRSADDLGAEVALGEETARIAREELGVEGVANLEDAWEGLDVLLTLGGDGTLLSGARRAGPREVPVVGCNLGRLGFMTAGPSESLERMLGRLVAGEYEIEERLALDVTVVRSGSESGPPGYYALNDVVVHKSGFARLITLRLWSDGEEVAQYSADGIIVSTPTGSTAYSLSAGGPVLVPTLDALVATPISPHTLAVRPVVIPADGRVTIEVCPHSAETIVTVDGQVGSDLEVGDRVEAGRSERPVRLIRFPGQSFFSVLRRKLRWGDVRPRDR
jgi:NAD+ kinase